MSMLQRLLGGAAAAVLLSVGPVLGADSYPPPAGASSWDPVLAGSFARMWGDAANQGACRDGQAQSPVNLTAPVSASLSAIRFDYSAYPVAYPSMPWIAYINNGRTQELVLDPDEYRPPKPGEQNLTTKFGPKHIENNFQDPPAVRGIWLDGTFYKLLQLHFHHPSEHTLDNVRYPMEMHLVHESEAGRKAVVAVFLSGRPTRPGSRVDFALTVMMRTRLPNNDRPGLMLANKNGWSVEELIPPPAQRSAYRRYDGSLTTPPCTQNVTWIVFTNAVTIPQDAINNFKGMFPANARPSRNASGRRIVTPQ